MKKIILILFALVISCTSPERKIKNSYDFQRGNVKVNEVIIYDTLYVDKLIDDLNFFQGRIKILEKSLKQQEIYRDSIIQLQYTKIKQDSLLRIGFEKRRRYNKELDYISFKENIIESIFSQMNDTIAGYYARVITKYDTIGFIVNPNTFRIIIPVSMYEK